MLNKVNYMDEIRKIENAITCIDEGKKSKETDVIKSRLTIMLHNLEETADEMANYIFSNNNEERVYYLKQINNANLEQNNYKDYLCGLTKLLRMERIMLICSTQSPAEKTYFLREYAAYKEEKENLQNQKVR